MPFPDLRERWRFTSIYGSGAPKFAAHAGWNGIDRDVSAHIPIARKRPPAPCRAAYARPYTGIAVPLVGAESSDSRWAMTPAISAGLTQRSWSAFGIEARLPGVSITLGRIALQRTPSSRY